MTSSYYLWKWADNDLPGHPNDVYSELLHGRMHPAIQAFDLVPVVRQLEQLSAQGRLAGEEWDWQIHPASSGQQAAFIFLTCPAVERYGQMRRRFCHWLLYLDITGYDEQRGQLMYCFPPKKNCWEWGDWDEIAYDITEDDLPILFKRMASDTPVASAVFENRQNHFVQCAPFKRRFTVEWRENYDLADFSKFGQWRAEYFDNELGRRRFFLPNCWESNRVNKNSELVPLRTGKRKHELFLYQDTLRIFRAFLHGEPRPSQYRWQDIKDELP
jgi:hypothetical protein